MANSSFPRLVSLNRTISWLLVLVSSVVLLTGYGLTILNLESPVVVWAHWVLGGVVALLSAVHMYISIVLIRYSWRAVASKIRRREVGPLTWLRLAQRVSGLVVALSALLVLLSGFDWFKLGTGWLVPFSSHVGFDVYLSMSIIFHSAVGLYFALLRRRLRRGDEAVRPVLLARREALTALAGMALSLIAAFYLDRIPKIGGTVGRIRSILPPGQYEVAELRRLHVGSVPPFNEGSWTLEVLGMVKNPFTLGYNDVRGLPRVVSVSDFHCVTGWSKLENSWEGVRFRTIMEMAGPLEGVRYASIICEHGYSTSLPIKDLARDDVLLAYGLDGRELPPEHGGPLRLVVPHKYGYKSAKWVRGIEFIEANELGYWESRGYSDTADPFTNDRYSHRSG